ncbi:MAG: peptidylprolyl isomerase [Caldilineaceae bacterium]
MKKQSSKTDSKQLPVILAICAIPVILALFLVLNNINQRSTVLTATPTLQPTTEAASAAGSALTAQGVPVEVASRNGKYKAPPPMTIDTKKYYYATFKTAQGEIKVQLFANQTPNTVNNFVFLAREGFYNNTTFHRVLENFMAQGGDPTATGGGGPGYIINDEFGPGLVFDRPGLLAMANAGPNTNGSQFFITFSPQPSLNGRHTIFGEVIEGLDVLAKIKLRDPEKSPDFVGDALTSVEIEESDISILPTPTPLPPTPTPFSPSELDTSLRPLATLSATARSNYFNAPPTDVIIGNQSYTATMLTSQGTMTLELRGDLAPVAVNNFVLLADLGFYDKTPVNRVSDGDSIIIGSPANQPESDAGYGFSPETNLAVKPDLGYIAYVPKTNDPAHASSSQLFILFGDPGPEMNQRYSFFGRITQGVEVLTKLTVSDTVESITVLK